MGIKAAIVDDDIQAIEKLKLHLERYSKENDIPISITCFFDSSQFLFEFQPIYDVIFLDVQMPKYNGMQVAESIRKKDNDVDIIFETQFGEYALQGYKYDALDYFIKPCSYPELKMRMDMVKEKASKNSKIIKITTMELETLLLKSNDILYVEEVGRKQSFHLIDGKEYVNSKRESLATLEKKLKDCGFYRCNSGFLLNLNQCTSIKKNKVYIKDLSFDISRAYRKEFLSNLYKSITIKG